MPPAPSCVQPERLRRRQRGFLVRLVTLFSPLLAQNPDPHPQPCLWWERESAFSRGTPTGAPSINPLLTSHLPSTDLSTMYRLSIHPSAIHLSSTISLSTIHHPPVSALWSTTCIVSVLGCCARFRLGEAREMTTTAEQAVVGYQAHHRRTRGRALKRCCGPNAGRSAGVWEARGGFGQAHVWSGPPSILNL